MGTCGNFEREGYDRNREPQTLRVMLSYDLRLIKLCQMRLRSRAELSEEAETCAFLPTVTQNAQRTLEVYRGSAITCAISRQTSAR